MNPGDKSIFNSRPGWNCFGSRKIESATPMEKPHSFDRTWQQHFVFVGCL